MLRKILATATGAVLAMSLGAAAAYFTAQVQVPDSVIKAGAVAVSTEPTVAPLSIDALAPGVSVTRPLAVVNSGSLPCDIVVTSSKKAGITEFYESLECTVSCAGTQLYAGSLQALRTQALRMSPGARCDLRFDVGMPASVTNSLAEDYAKLSLYIDAEQAH